MKLRMYSIYDKKSMIFHPPQFCHNDQHAMRMYHMDLSKPGMVMSQYPDDFSIYCVGEFEDHEGKITGFATPTYVIGLDVLLSGKAEEDGKTDTEISEEKRRIEESVTQPGRRVTSGAKP